MRQFFPDNFIRKFKALIKGRNFRVDASRLLVVSVISLLLSSCVTLKKNTYFQGIQNDTTLHNLVTKDLEPKIQNGDLLSITVSSLSPENTTIYNAPQNAEGTMTGYLVDENGDIDFIKLGTIHVAGMTRRELKVKLQKELTPYLSQAVVAIGFLNRHVTVIGPSSTQVVPLVNNDMTLLDALATNGGIVEKGKANDILVIRENGNSKTFKKIDLTDQSVFYSPYYYLKPDDIIYVKPNNRKQVTLPQILSYVTTAISLTLVIITRL